MADAAGEDQQYPQQGQSRAEISKGAADQPGPCPVAPGTVVRFNGEWQVCDDGAGAKSSWEVRP